MIAEALEAAWLVASALAAWIVAGVVAVTVGLYGVVVAVTLPVHAACTALGAALAAAGALRALGEQPGRYRPPQRPSWAAA
ncbi:hypothetical protein [Streptomyces sp. AMCC400023]|uniref:hypothetical protein n=1 Tax=Streptomyces sp. AMCC400023 TaxID=2056258 RepID=UPI001F1E22FE|nr:hypothetical protein [Streptomyces sp. AMCC400023]UJV42049.1 hypothetical protein CVT30_21345 [Streptomyces sp. AMCC400023]